MFLGNIFDSLVVRIKYVWNDNRQLKKHIDIVNHWWLNAFNILDQSPNVFASGEELELEQENVTLKWKRIAAMKITCTYCPLMLLNRCVLYMLRKMHFTKKETLCDT